MNIDGSEVIVKTGFSRARLMRILETHIRCNHVHLIEWLSQAGISIEVHYCDLHDLMFSVVECPS